MLVSLFEKYPPPTKNDVLTPLALAEPPVLRAVAGEIVSTTAAAVKSFAKYRDS
jgi:hypothetical protein